MDRNTDVTLQPQGYREMFVIWDHLMQRLCIESYFFVCPLDLAKMSFPWLPSLMQSTRTCSMTLKGNIEILLDSMFLNPIPDFYENLEHMLEIEFQGIQQWKRRSLSLTYFHDIHKFLSQTSVVINDMVFFISFSDLDEKGIDIDALKTTQNSKISNINGSNLNKGKTSN